MPEGAAGEGARKVEENRSALARETCHISIRNVTNGAIRKLDARCCDRYARLERRHPGFRVRLSILNNLPPNEVGLDIFFELARTASTINSP
jgi:hypothetical protein